jgi:glyoxalase family protein
MSSRGIHHITAMAGGVQANTDFYGVLLGMPMTKVTVNFDEPSVYHTYFGVDGGAPGTNITFFPWPHIVPGQLGGGEASRVGYGVAEGTLGDWEERLAAEAVSFDSLDSEIHFAGPDGELLALREESGTGDGVLGFSHVVLDSLRAPSTVAVLTKHLGFEETAPGVLRAPGEGPGREVQVRQAEMGPGRMGAGTVHHIAFRAADDDDQARIRESLINAGLHPTEVKERCYFRSIYFREPGGLLFEVATDGPGFAIDEPDGLARGLMLPPFHEARRASLLGSLPPFRTPEGVEMPR